MYPFWADVMVGLHLAYVCFVLFGQIAIYIGVLFGWSWARNPWLRWIHLIMIGVVAVEAVLDIQCPCTTWEVQLRTLGGQEVSAKTFVGRCFDELMFPEWPEHVYFMVYIGMFAWVFDTFLLAPPRAKSRVMPYLQLVCAILITVATCYLYPTWKEFELPNIAFPFAYVIVVVIGTFVLLPRLLLRTRRTNDHSGDNSTLHADDRAMR